MRIENNVNLKQAYYKNSNIKNYGLKPMADTISFAARYNIPSKGLSDKLTDIIFSPIKAIKTQIEKSKLKAKLKREAEEAAKRAEKEAIEARLNAEKAKKLQKIKEVSKELLTNWQTRYKGLFQERKYIDNTGDVLVRPANEFDITRIKPVAPPKRGEYTLANFGIHEGYASNPAGQQAWLIRGADGTVVTPLGSIWSFSDESYFADHRWRILHTYTMNKITKNYHKCTVLSSGFPHVIEQSLNRHPGVNFVIEGHIPLKDMQQIKKNIVEKGLWKNYIEHEDIDAHLGIYNEIINYLNK